MPVNYCHSCDYQYDREGNPSAPSSAYMNLDSQIVNALKNINHQKDHIIEAYQAKLQMLETENEHLRSSNQSLVAEQKKVDSLNEKLKQCHDVIHDKNCQIANLNSEISNLNIELEKKDGGIESLVAHKVKLESQNQTYKDRNHSLQRTIIVLEQKIKDLEKDKSPLLPGQLAGELLLKTITKNKSNEDSIDTIGDDWDKIN